MKVLATNLTYTLFSDSKEIFLVNSTTTQLIHRKQIEADIGYLQYATGIVAVCKQSQILIYDMLYDKELYTYNAYQTVLKIYFLKNLLIVITQQRITIHDVDKKKSLWYLTIFSGEHVFIHPNYYELKVFYPKNDEKLINRFLWNSSFQTYRGIRYQHGCYMDQGNSICLAYDNIVSIYHKEKLIHLCILQNNISMIRLFNNNLYVTTTDKHFKIVKNQQKIQQIETSNKKIMLKFNDDFEDKISMLPQSQNSELWFTKNWIFCREKQHVKYLKYDNIVESSMEVNQPQISLQILSKLLSQEQQVVENISQYNILNQQPISVQYEENNQKKQQQQQYTNKSDLLNFWVSKTKIKQEELQKQGQQQQQVQIPNQQYLKNRLSVNIDEQNEKQ